MKIETVKKLQNSGNFKTINDSRDVDQIPVTINDSITLETSYKNDSKRTK